MKYNRLEDMEQYIEKRHTCTNEELQQAFHISIQTLRRDLEELKAKGVITKIYGGVLYKENRPSKSKVDSLDERSSSNLEAKQAIGKLSAKLLEDNDVIFVDSGTTACHLIPFIPETFKVTVISHSLHVMEMLCDHPNLTGICLGGTLHNETRTFFTDTSFYPYNYNKAFISTVGISINNGLTNTDYSEGVMKQHVMQHSSKIYIVADRSKFGVVAFNHFADFNRLDGIITEGAPEENYVRYFETLHIPIIY